MSPNLTNAQRIQRARKLIQQARKLPVPAEMGKNDFSYIAQVKELLRQARYLVQFIPNNPSASAEIKEEVQNVFTEIEQTNQDLLH